MDITTNALSKKSILQPEIKNLRFLDAILQPSITFYIYQMKGNSHSVVFV